MKLLKEIIQRKLEVAKDLELNTDLGKAFWIYNEIAKLSSLYLGLESKNLLKNEKIILKLMVNINNINLISKIREITNSNVKIIEISLNSMEETEETAEIEENFYPYNIFAVHLDERE